MTVKYTKEILQAAVNNSSNFSDVLRKLGIFSWSGSQWTNIKNRITQYNIDISHFDYKPKIRKPKREILIKRDKSKGREDSKVLRNAFMQSGIEYVCSECKTPPQWNNKELVLEIDHINGDWSDNRIKNLRFLCPNCHSQTPTYRRTKRENNCIDCNKEISRQARRCRPCARKEHSKLMKNKGFKINWPDHDILLQMVKDMSKTKVAKKLGVSEAAVRKKLKRRDSAGDET